VRMPVRLKRVIHVCACVHVIQAGVHEGVAARECVCVLVCVLALALPINNLAVGCSIRHTFGLWPTVVALKIAQCVPINLGFIFYTYPIYPNKLGGKEERTRTCIWINGAKGANTCIEICT